MEDHKALALEESAEWSSLPAEERKKYGSQREYWKQRGRKQREVEARHFILRALGAESFLWTEAANGLPLVTAVSLVRKSRKLNTSLSEVWKEYQVGSTVQARGKTFKRVAKTKHGKRSFDPTLQLVEKALNEDPMLASLDQFTRDKYVYEALTAFRMTLSDLRQRIRRDPNVYVSRKQMVIDCRSFNVEPPDIGQPVDLDAARKARGQKVSQLQLHPDQRGGDLSQIPLYHEIMEAFQRLQMYNDQLPKKDST